VAQPGAQLGIDDFGLVARGVVVVLGTIAKWYNAHRAHTWLGGKTPDKAYCGKYPTKRRPRFEPRERWPRRSPCARPWALVRSKAGAKLTLQVAFCRGRKYLPIVTLHRAA
jgi:hypothetical protein